MFVEYIVNETYDIIILGAGPAGLQAAIHASRTKVSVLILGKPENSSIYKAHIENYCCLDYIEGETLLKQGMAQAQKFGADFLSEDCIETQIEKDQFVITTETGKKLKAQSIIFTLGVTRNSLNVPGESSLRGHGVSYCVDCDANFFKDKPVAIVGNGSAAVSGALTLASYTDTVHLISEKIAVSEDLNKQIRQSAVTIHEEVDIEEITGEKVVEGVKLSNQKTIAVNGVFIELGAKGALELAGFLGIEMTENLKHIQTSKKQETSIPGIYAAGDICGPPWQIAKAVGEGCVAGLEAAAYVKKKNRPI